MTSTSVGMRCPECAKQKTPVRTVRSLSTTPTVTYVLIAINVLAFFGSASGGSSFTGGGSGSVFTDAAVLAYGGPGIGVAEGEYWRLLTGGFLHSGLLHILFNMYILYYLGSMLEPGLGRARFIGLYFASLLAGSFGAILLEPDALTVGASGAVFGLMGAAFVMQRSQGINPMQSGIGPLILLNLAIGFIPGLNISIGGHLGGLVGGAAAAWLMQQTERRRLPVGAAVAACAVVGVLAVAAAIIRSTSWRDEALTALVSLF